ncbi:MAG: potassium channel family protein [Actinobacteria bacterium]|nr:potassium channel family protein [Actinomycetota bacterium]
MTEQPSHHQHLDEPRRQFGRRWLDLTSENHILVAPFISLAAFICIALGNKSIVAALIALLLQSALFQIAVVAHIRQPQVRRIAYITAPFLIIAIVIIAGALARLVGVDSGRFVLMAFSAGLTLGVIVRIFGRVAKAPIINAGVVVNAVTVYLMLGLFFAYVYMSLSAAAGEAFFAQGSDQPTTVFLYFSYVTLATVGYGDFTPAFNAGRFAAVAEGLMGQLYLVTVLALIVSNLGRQRNGSMVPLEKSSDTTPTDDSLKD